MRKHADAFPRAPAEQRRAGSPCRVPGRRIPIECETARYQQTPSSRVAIFESALPHRRGAFRENLQSREAGGRVVAVSSRVPRVPGRRPREHRRDPDTAQLSSPKPTHSRRISQLQRSEILEPRSGQRAWLAAPRKSPSAPTGDAVKDFCPIIRGIRGACLFVRMEDVPGCHAQRLCVGMRIGWTFDMPTQSRGHATPKRLTASSGTRTGVLRWD